MSDPTFNLIVIRSADIDRASRFYAALGIRFERERHGDGPEHVAAQLGSVVFEIYPGSSEETVGVRLGFRVDSLSEVIDAAVRSGGRVVTSPRESEWGRRAVLADPDGHRIELTEA